MSIEEYNEELTKIKQFHAYLNSILDTGYMNEIEDLKSLTKQLDNINLVSTNSNINADFIDENTDLNNEESDYDCIPFLNNNDLSSESPSSSDTEDESNNYKPVNINKEQDKINRFMTYDVNDIYQQCCNISLYKANGFDYIDNMKKFIKNSFIY